MYRTLAAYPALVTTFSFLLLTINPVHGLDYGETGDGSSETGDFGIAPSIDSKASLDSKVDAGAPVSIHDRWASAIANDDTKTLVSLFQEHAARNDLVAMTSNNGKDALMVACKTGDLEFARQLVADGANINKVTLTGGTPFMFSVLGNELAIARWLHEQGANIDAQGSNGWSAVTIAAAKGQAHLLSWLISIGANANAADVYQFSPLMRAVDNGHVDAVVALLAAPGIEIDSQDEANNTALHYAVAGDRPDLARLLLAQGAKRDIENRNGQTANSMAQGEPAWVRLFENH